MRRSKSAPVNLSEPKTDTPSAYHAARDMLTKAAITFTGVDTPKGCLLASATASCSSEAADVQLAIADIRHGIAAQLRSKIRNDISGGILPLDTDGAALAGLVMTVTQDISVLARDGAARKQLLSIVEHVLHTWPKQPRRKKKS